MIDDLKTRLANTNARSSQGPWTTTTLILIATNPGKRATELAESGAGNQTLQDQRAEAQGTGPDRDSDRERADA